MQIHRDRRTPLVGRILAVAALLTVCGSGTIALAGTSPRSTLAGTWAGQYSGALAGSFTIHWTQTGTVLHGSITLSNPKGNYGISGKVRGTAISFGAVGAGATYTGSVSGSSMSGSWKSSIGGGKWSAHKSS